MICTGLWRLPFVVVVYTLPKDVLGALQIHTKRYKKEKKRKQRNAATCLLPTHAVRATTYISSFGNKSFCCKKHGKYQFTAARVMGSVHCCENFGGVQILYCIHK
jgi:hypothetical protein